MLRQKIGSAVLEGQDLRKNPAFWLGLRRVYIGSAENIEAAYKEISPFGSYPSMLCYI
ncbi:hypothetical protein AM1_1303 [Acaryochloris marina MBIC11017]|uniref:Uncharacterized protein n=1 Tax=Acaryochloris marina (strain MBIC 11017) TaxID=329726 RepID=B0C597_ACAM1|nr:hypothetical protein AM1_1303 [Acaryochloris marina MBIC11017]